MKKVLSISLIAFIAFFGTKNVSALEITENGMYKNYNQIIISEEELNNLKDLGFTDKQIELMDQNEFDSNKNLQGEVVAQTTKYYKTITNYTSESLIGVRTLSDNKVMNTYSVEITEDEYNNLEQGISPLGLSNGYTETNGKKMTTTIIAVNGRYRYKNDVTWKNVPKVRSYDIIGIGIDNTVSGISGTKQFKRTVDVLSTDNCYFDSSTSATWTLSGTGYAATFKLPTDSKTYKMQGLDIYMYFEVQKLTAVKIYTLNAYGDYKHAIRTVTSSVSSSISIGTSGLNFDTSYQETYGESYDSIDTAQATWSGLKW